MRSQKIEKLPKKARVMLLGIALSALGNGLVLPYTFIYFHNIRGYLITVAVLIASYGTFAATRFNLPDWPIRPINSMTK